MTYWRFILRNFGELCGLCAWVLAYQGRWSDISVHESSKAVIACRRCEDIRWTVASYHLPKVHANGGWLQVP